MRGWNPRTNMDGRRPEREADDRDRSPTEPLHARLGEPVDLHELATWEPRTAVDRVSVWLTGALRGNLGGLLVVVALLLLVVQFAGIWAILRSDPTIAALTVLSIVPAVVLVGFIWVIDPTLRQPPRAMAGVFLLAVVFASFAALINTIMRFGFVQIPIIGLTLFFFLVVGPVEEFVKWLAVRIGGFRTIQSVIDGAVYGAVAGLGFATIENLIYITQSYLAAAGAGAGPGAELVDVDQLAAAAATAATRSFVGPGHVIYSAIAGYYLGLAKFNPDHYGPIVIKGLLIAALIHAGYNTAVTHLVLPGPWLLVFIGLVNGLLFILLIHRIDRYRRTFRAVPGEYRRSR